MNPIPRSLPSVFKGIALFTPGGDVVYCIDEAKQNRWHLQLCAVLQDALKLPEPPHFLVPCYTATLDCWWDREQERIQVAAEVFSPVARSQALLNVLFEMPQLTWQVVRSQPEACSPLVLQTYRQDFAALWDCHDLIIRCDPPGEPRSGDRSSALSWSPTGVPTPPAAGYVLRLFISGHSPATERILHNLHQSLEQSLHQPYTLKVIDVHKHPDLVEADQIAATPTLLKVWPPPVKRIVGNLEDLETILRILTAHSPLDGDYGDR